MLDKLRKLYLSGTVILKFFSRPREIENSTGKYHGKVLLSSFHLNGYTVGFHPQRVADTIKSHTRTAEAKAGAKGKAKKAKAKALPA